MTIRRRAFLATVCLLLAAGAGADDFDLEIQGLRDDAQRLREESLRLSDLAWVKDQLARHRLWLVRSAPFEERNARDGWRQELGACVEAQRDAIAVLTELAARIEEPVSVEARREGMRRARMAEDRVRLAELRLRDARQTGSLRDQLDQLQVTDGAKSVEQLERVNASMVSARQQQIESSSRLDELEKEQREQVEELQRRIREAREAREAEQQKAAKPDEG